MLFSVLGNGKVSKPEAIFRPPLTQKKTAWTIFSVLAEGNLSTYGTIFCPLRRKIASMQSGVCKYYIGPSAKTKILYRRRLFVDCCRRAVRAVLKPDFVISLPQSQTHHQPSLQWKHHFSHRNWLTTRNATAYHAANSI